MTDAFASTLPPEKREEVALLMGKYVRVEAVNEAMLLSMVKHFTARELNALADFYSSPEGKSAMAKLGAYMADAMPMIQAEVQRAWEASRAEQAKTPGT
jgi:hypothetical protein